MDHYPVASTYSRGASSDEKKGHTLVKEAPLLGRQEGSQIRLLILGGDGMLGHKLVQMLTPAFDTYATFRSDMRLWAACPFYSGIDARRLLGGIDVLSFAGLQRVVERLKPEALINCIGIIKQREEAKSAVLSIKVNSLFPRQLAELCTRFGVRLIHLSTDCVFSGIRGRYSESDVPDPVDLYGRTKLLGELDQPGCLTLRTSMIGWELDQRLGLLEWFAAQRHRTIKGFRRAVYTGLSTTALATLIRDLLVDHPDLSGIYHVASLPITKYDLLSDVQAALGWDDISIEPDDTVACDRSLIGTRFELASGWRAPSWEMMIAGLAAEWPVYESMRRLGRCAP